MHRYRIRIEEPEPGAEAKDRSGRLLSFSAEYHENLDAHLDRRYLEHYPAKSNLVTLFCSAAQEIESQKGFTELLGTFTAGAPYKVAKPAM